MDMDKAEISKSDETEIDFKLFKTSKEITK